MQLGLKNLQSSLFQGTVKGINSGIQKGLDRHSKTHQALASGGDITYHNGYVIHTFKSTGEFIPKVPLLVDYLVVAGGGAGGGVDGGGGGAGGVKMGTAFSVVAQPFKITVGAGGVGATNARGTAGGNS